jgi:hypothetical protein
LASELFNLKSDTPMSAKHLREEQRTITLVSHPRGGIDGFNQNYLTNTMMKNNALCMNIGSTFM